MHPFFHIFDREISGYALMGVIGFLSSLLYAFLACRKRKVSFDDAAYILTFAFIGGLAGAKILYLLIEMPALVQDLSAAGENWATVAHQYFSGGMVFYGGLFGGVAGALLSARFFKVDIKKLYGIYVPVLPLFSGFGRIGCFLMGCCYGKETTGPFGVIYTQSLIAPNFVELLPVQLYEAVFDFALFIILVVLGRDRKTERSLLKLYLFAYASFRFILEFFRGDKLRGVALLSTSQWISLVILAVLLGLIVRGKWGKRDVI